MDKKFDWKYSNWVMHDDIEGFECDPGVTRRILAYCDEIMAVENSFEQGAVGSMHCHPHTQITYIAEGEFEFTIGGETKIVKKGDTLLKQNSIMHGCKCLKKGIVMDFFTPMRKEFVGEE